LFRLWIMPVNIEIAQDQLDACLSSIPQGWDINTWVKPCFFIYDQDPDTCTIRIEDHSEIIAFYDADTDVYEATVTILDSDGIVCYSGVMDSMGSFSFELPYCGMWEVQINLTYTIQYVIDNDPPIPHTFQIAYIYPIECVRSFDCKVAETQCVIQKRKCVGRDYCELQNNIYALINYRYALCHFEFSVAEFDMISCAVKLIKKAC